MCDWSASPPTVEEHDRVLARVKALCYLPEGEGGCWIWRGTNADSRTLKPLMYFRGRAHAVRRVVFFVHHGFVPPPGMSASGCGVHGCVAPGCVHALPRKAVMRRAARAGACSTPEANRNRKAAAQARARYGDDVVQLVRSLDCSAAEAARIVGMSKAHVINIRSGRARTPLDASPPPARGTRQQAVMRRLASAAAQRHQAGRIDQLAKAAKVAGMWAGLLPSCAQDKVQRT